MDAKQTRLEEKLADLLEQAARVATQIQAEQQGPGTPHYDRIEGHAHQVGQQLSRKIQAGRLGDVAAEQSTQISCPQCGRQCQVVTAGRTIQSTDGPLEIAETTAHCRRCRRSFFPSA